MHALQTHLAPRLISRKIAAHSAVNLLDVELASLSTAVRELLASKKTSSTGEGASGAAAPPRTFGTATETAAGTNLVAPCACWRFFLAIFCRQKSCRFHGLLIGSVWSIVTFPYALCLYLRSLPRTPTAMGYGLSLHAGRALHIVNSLATGVTVGQTKPSATGLNVAYPGCPVTKPCVEHFLSLMCVPRI